jgi:hypothetical protein
MTELSPHLPVEPAASQHKKTKKSRMSRAVAIATIVSAILAIPAAFYPIWKDAGATKTDTKPQTRRLYDGTIASIATHWESWDIRGFDPRDLNSPASPVTYQYAGHYKDDTNGDRNPTNRMCTMQLYANPSGAFPYGGASGFVYVQAGTSSRPEGEILYNPKNPDAVYRMQIKNGQYVPPECWPGDGDKNNDVRYLHDFGEYR